MSRSSFSSWASDINDMDSVSDRSGRSIFSYVSASSAATSFISTSTSISRFTSRQPQGIEDEGLATQESKHLVKLRFFLITVLFWSTVGVGLAVWTYFTEEIDNEFEEHYWEESEEARTELQNKFLVAIGSIDSFIVALCIQSSAWPFVTVPRFSDRAERLRKFSHAVAVTTYHYVDEDLRQEWSEYASANDHRQGESLHLHKQKDETTLQQNIMLGRESNNEFLRNHGNLSSFMPMWQQSPVTKTSPSNWDGFQYGALADAWNTFQQQHGVVMSYVNNIETISLSDLNIEERNQFISGVVPNNTNHTEPFGDIFYPIVYDHEIEEITVNSNSSKHFSTNDVIGVVAVTFYWRDLLKDMFSNEIDGMHVVFENNCNQSFTYTWSDSNPLFLGTGDLHEPEYDDMQQSFSLTDIEESDMYTGLPLSSSGCQYAIHFYPSEAMSQHFNKGHVSPATFTGIAVVIFVFTTMVFVFYDCLVERRQRKVYSSAMKNNAIVSSLFPKSVRDRLYQENDPTPKNAQPPKTRLKTFMHEDNDATETKKEFDAPIADLFSNCTVLFADISGFTSWSSERSPCQVFVLLETIYGAFDKIADRRGVFKVETIGDCYMAVTGLPNPKRDHALIMARFARDCRNQMNALTKSLEVTLGPETSDLSMRFGLHSGPVTAGVLRGRKSRFQLFGDTVNTAARMESTGISNQIHVSEETARLLTDGGKSSWLTPRKETVLAKGKGELTTYWLFQTNRIKRGSTANTVATSDDSIGSLESPLSGPKRKANVTPFVCDRRARLIDWNVDLFAGMIRKIVARREAYTMNADQNKKLVSNLSEKSITHTDSGMVMDEVVEIIELPAFDPRAINLQEDPHFIKLEEDVMTQLRNYIFTISSTYNNNPFHNFEHASHVTLSVAKLLSRIVAPDLEINSNEHDVSSTLHDHTYGITSDPLTQFACVLAALIHDVDHQGVPNTTLVEENDEVAKKYRGRSVAEQNSVDIAWALFLEPQFRDLRKTVCGTEDELNRLRQLIVNTVLATDIMDKDLKQLRNQRWEKAFSPDLKNDNENDQDQINRKATIVLEHLIQASDVCHTMQHWHVYRKWNERLFEEMYLAYKMGRAKADPSTFWYKGELGFFDHYIIPLSKKLSNCGVFGVSSDEYLNYALRNRKEWEQRGNSIVTEMVNGLQDRLQVESREVC
mmetsp:Transcript_13427/g.37784  ORF Transcript_13427/g.37784 Transcript_13427/m.37784 type:complete len:1181 (+) Transcript_13427:148-3690(+)|eukprot:CAMPEP_0172366364 /NCGR_PEP_ID=MMETSP1060-20121228/14790_1 /TAXON_ID=37318 /ORGANISM="Pseudo-nitzschia pungens, Strain cf. cingulata" /LENGTH=1180 /DNA_ID=CAMNT_0013090189 /DNA_START=62 /DNA_END=3604 /DNA_ORIENTATION=-